MTGRLVILAGLFGLALFQISAAVAKDLRLEDYFHGRTVALGKFDNRLTGEVRRFKVVLHGSWNGRVLRLCEDFIFEDGERDRKTWFFTPTGPRPYIGAREDVVGQALIRLDGNKATMGYIVELGAILSNWAKTGFG